jgi:hypothetical protein
MQEYYLFLKILVFWDVTPCSVEELTDVSQEHAASLALPP